jgi:hypothetical protein
MIANFVNGGDGPGGSSGEEERPSEQPFAKRVARLNQIVDARALAQIGRWEQPFLRERPAPPLVVDQDPPLHVEAESWLRRSLDVHERHVGGEIMNDLRQCVPQALLRDIHRPVRPEGRPFPERPPPRDPAGIAALAEARAAQRFQRAEMIPLSVGAVRDEQARRRAWLAERWQPYYRDDEEHPPVQVVTW